MYSRQTTAILCTFVTVLAAGFVAREGAAQVFPDPDRPLQYMVNTTPFSAPYFPLVSMTHPDGRFVVVWRQSNPMPVEIFLQRFDAGGNAVGPVESVYDCSVNSCEPLSVSSDLHGNFVVVFTEGDRPEHRVLARIWDDDQGGFPLDPPIEILSHRLPGGLSAAVDPNGNFVVAWTEVNLGERWVEAQRYEPNGSTDGDSFLPGGFSGTCDQSDPSVSKDLSGGFVVTWECCGDVCARLYDAEGNPLSDQFTVNSTTGTHKNDPKVVTRPSGGFIVAWREATDLPSFKIFDNSGVAISDDLPLSGLGGIAAGDPAGHFMTTWGSNPVYGQWIDKDGVMRGPPLELPSYSEGYSDSPVVAADLSGNYITVWIGENPDSIPGTNDVFARRFMRPVMLTISDISLSEGDGDSPTESTAVFTVEASCEHPFEDVTVDWVTNDGTATFFEDYVYASGRCEFPTGSLTNTVDVQITGDTEFEPDETFFVDLRDVEHAVIVKSRGVGTILNDDLEPAVRILAPDNDVPEAMGHVTLSVTLSPPQNRNASVQFNTLSHAATVGYDFEGIEGTLVIPAGSTEGNVAVEIIDDEIYENREDFFVELSNSVNARIVVPSAQVWIEDNDCPVPITVFPTQEHFGAEGGTGSFVVTDGENCGWQVVSDPNATWLEVTAPPGGAGVGNGIVEFSVAENLDDFPRDPPGVISVVAADFIVTQDGLSCEYLLDSNQAVFESGGGTGTVHVSDPEECGWTATSNDEWISIVSIPADPGDGFVEYSVAANQGVNRSGFMTIAGIRFDVQQSGIFFDDFNDNLLAPSWIYQGTEYWEESGGRLRASPGDPGETALAVARWAFPGCSEGIITTRMRVNNFSMGTVSLLGWYADEDNNVSLTMNEFSNTWTLTRREHGVDVQTATSNAFPVDVNVTYEVELSLLNGEFVVVVDGVWLIGTVLGSGVEPQGTVGFRVTESEADFDEISAIVITPLNIFMDGFETADTSRWTLTTP